MAASPQYQLFEEVLRTFSLAPALVVRTLEATPREQAREGVPVADLSDRHYLDCFALVSGKKVAKEGLPELLKAMAENPQASAEDAARMAGLVGADQDRVESLISRVVVERADFVREHGERAQGPLMGVVMKELRGKADGALVSTILKREIEKITGR